MAAYKNYLKLCLLFTSVFCLSLLCNYIFIVHSYENISYKEIVEVQQRMHAIWGSALNPHTVSYKYELFKHKKPELIVLGSSLSYGFRQEFFTTSFANCSGVMSFLDWGRIFLQKILNVHKPHLVILTIDFDHFSDRYPRAESEPSFADRGTDYLIYKLRQPFMWLWQGKLTFTDYFNILVFKDIRNKVTNYNNLGVLAIKRSDGYREDGSYSYAGLVSGFHPGFFDKKFKGSMKQVEEGTGQFWHGDNLSVHSINELTTIIKICHDHDIKLVIIMPPVAPAVFEKMQSMPGAYKFIGKLRQYIRSLTVEAYDFLDNRDVGTCDCEFIDGYHPGDVAIQKMLLAIIKQNPESALRNYLNVDLMQSKVRENSGKTMTIYDPAKYNFPEIDFLEIGCQKKPS